MIANIFLVLYLAQFDRLESTVEPSFEISLCVISIDCAGMCSWSLLCQDTNHLSPRGNSMASQIPGQDIQKLDDISFSTYDFDICQDLSVWTKGDTVTTPSIHSAIIRPEARSQA
jgi:hypothetical protein